MSAISAEKVKELREATQAGMMDCKKALSESGGDFEKAVDLLRKKGLSKAAKRAGRQTEEGLVYSYIHPGSKLGVLIEVGCETDFVAKSDEFEEFVKNLAMQVAAANPFGIVKEDIPADIIEREKEIYISQARETGKPENILEKIAEGKMSKFYKESCLISQAYIRDPNITIEDLLNQIKAKVGENINIKRFARFEIGK